MKKIMLILVFVFVRQFAAEHSEYYEPLIRYEEERLSHPRITITEGGHELVWLESAPVISYLTSKESKEAERNKWQLLRSTKPVKPVDIKIPYHDLKALKPSHWPNHCRKKKKENLLAVIQDRIEKAQNLNAIIDHIVDGKSRNTPLIEACESDEYLESTRLLLLWQADPNLKGKDKCDYQLPLHRAISSVAVQTVQTLLTANVDVNEKDDTGWTALDHFNNIYLPSVDARVLPMLPAIKEALLAKGAVGNVIIASTK